MIVEFSDDEVALLIGVIHGWQDILVESSDDLAQQEHPDDHEAGRAFENQIDRLDVIRKKLGDTWEANPSYAAPDDLSSLNWPLDEEAEQ